ncbi:hypothetical protein AQUCO_10000042v1 [Aquilegia coerulea]|uniref:Uncharacterized protein n=1 Tax=Aquilegia coerulea TaxID=218851 RepID=A0A2G5C5N8_AQUCA|nr:hypothetical protein AQUCO_10000042v1 [Aquilegia coerulea]
MEAALHYAQSFPTVTTTKPPSSTGWLKPSSMIKITPPSPHTSRSKVMARAPENSIVDYTSKTSVFPAEACETIGGDACDAEIFPEVKLKAEDDENTKAKITQESVDREYLEYNEPKTVFPDEACDDLGGEFCQPDYQKGVY